MMYPSLNKNTLGGNEGLKKGKISSLVFWACIWTLALFCSAFFVARNAQSAAPPSIITYQGKLLQSGASVTTTQDMGFLIYTQSTGGALVYSSTGTIPASTGTIPIAVNQGVFNVNFGGTGTNALPTTLFQNNTDLFLEVWINNGGTLVKLSPRKQITAAPFAINSQFLLGYSPAVTSSAQYIPVSDSNGNFTFTGTPQSSTVSGGVMYINPETANPNDTLFGVALNGSQRFRIDEDGDGWLSGAFSVTGTSTLATTTVSKLLVTGTTSGINLQDITGSSTLAYLAGDNAFTGVNTFSATSTFTTSTFNGNSIVNGFLHVTGNTLKPKALGSYTNNTLLDGVDEIVVQNNIAYIGTTTGTLALVDVSDPSNPTLLGSYTSTTLATTQEINLQVAGDFAYFGNDQKTFIIDISRPKNPRYIGSVFDQFGGDTGTPSFVLSGNYLHTTNFVGTGVPEYMDITNPQNAKQVSVMGSSDLNQGRDVAISGKYLYVLSSNSLVGIFDVRDLNHVTELGSVTDNNLSDVAFTSENGNIATKGRYVYVTAPQSSDGSAGDALTVIDAGNPNSPSVVGTLASSTNALLDDPTSIFISGDYAYITSYAQNALAIVDISDPTLPSVAASIVDSASSVLTGAKAVAVAGNYAYVVSQTDRSLQVIDVSGAKISNADIGSARISDIQVSGQSFFDSNLNIKGGLTVGNSGLLLRGDLSISGTTATSTGLYTTGTLHFAGPALFDSQAVLGDSAFIFRPKSSFTGNILSVRSGNNDAFLDIGSTGNFGIATSSPSFPLSVVGTGYIQGDFYVGSAVEQITTSTFTLSGDDIYIHDLLGVGNSVFVEQALYIGTSSLKLTGNPSGSQIRAGGGPLTLDSTGVLSFNTLNAQNIEFGGAVSSALTVKGKVVSPTSVGVVDLTFGDRVTVQGDYAYVGLISDGFSIIDISNPTSPTTTATFDPLGSVYQIAVSGNYAYISHNDQSNGITIVDVSDPTSPFTVKSWDPGQSFTDLTVSGNYLYAIDGDKLHIFDITDRTDPQTIGTWTGTSISELAIHGKYAFVAAEISKIYMLDISDPQNPATTTFFDTTLDIGDIKVSGNYAYTSRSGGVDNGLRIYDISDPAAISLTGTVTTTGSFREFDLAGDYAYVGDFTNGLQIIDVSDKSAPAIVSTIDPASSGALDAVAVGNYVYVATKADGLRVIDVSGIRASNAQIGVLKAGHFMASDFAEFENGVKIGNGLHIANNGLLLGGDFGMYSNSSSVNATNTLHFSHRVLFETAVTSTSNNAYIFDTKNTLASTNTVYLLSVRNNGTPVFSVSSVGDVHATGTFYGEAAAVGTPGAPGDLAERVDISLSDNVEPGDVMLVDLDANDKYRKSQSARAQNVAGVIATNPTIVLGNGKTENTAVMTMIGRVPVKVTDENGPIERGDLLVTASKPGYAMRYDKWQDTGLNLVGIVGIALEPLPVNSGKVMALVKTGWVQNRTQTIAEIQQDLITIAQSEGIIIGTSVQNLSIGEDENGQLQHVGENIDLNGYYIINVAGLFGENGSWEIDDQGRFVTQVQTSDGKKPLYALQSQKTEYVFSGSSSLQNGLARVDFDKVTQDIINDEKPIKVSITLTAEANGVFVETKDNTGFSVRELHGGLSNAGFDWVVIAQRKVEGVQEEPESQDPENVVATTTQEQVPVGETEEQQNASTTESNVQEESEEVTPGDSSEQTEEPVVSSTPEQVNPEEDTENAEEVVNSSSTEKVVNEEPPVEEPSQEPVQDSEVVGDQQGSENPVGEEAPGVEEPSNDPPVEEVNIDTPPEGEGI